jgi:isoleucyl-tRNA synthetase
VDEVVSITELGDVVSFELVPNFRSLGPKLGEAVKEVRRALDRLDVGEVAGTLERDEPVEIELSSGSVVLGPGDVELRVKSREGFAVSREGVAAVALDLQVDEALRTRGMVRDVIRQIQALRRERGLQMSDRIVVNLMGVDELQSWSEEIGREVLAQQVGFFSGAGDPSELEIDDGRQATVWIEKVADD